jgi:tetratricopeptide (TPR) repeat protein
MNDILTPQQIESEAKSFYQAGDYMKAAKSFEAALQGYTLANEVIMAAEMANNCSVSYLMAGESQSALQALEGAEFVFIQAGDQKRQAMTIGNQAAALDALGRLDEAEQKYWQAAEILKELGEIELRLPIMQSISSLQLRTGRHFQAVASMYAGVDKIKNPTLKQRFLKHLLGIPIQLLNNQSKVLPDGSDNNS